MLTLEREGRRSYSAASVWIVAAIGVAVGVHAYTLAIISTVLSLIVLEGFRWVERFLSPDSDSEL